MTHMQRPVPLYDDLPLSQFGGRHSWDLEVCAGVGTLGFIDDQTRLRALQSVRTGEVISLNAALDVIDPPLFGRTALQHSVETKREGLMLDDRIDALYPQVSSQWDALNHVGAAPGVFFGGSTLEAQLDGSANGIDVWARRGIVARAVLLDLHAVMMDKDPSYSPGVAISMTTSDLQDALARQGTTLEFGDILILYTGYLDWYRDQTLQGKRDISHAGSEVAAAGLAHTEDTARFLWDAGISAIASDSLGVEMWPPDREAATQPFGFLHSSLIGHLGMAIGELWELHQLRTRCIDSGRWDSLLVSAPLNLRGGVGSPANALAMR